jgi:hypothetical protein
MSAREDGTFSRADFTFDRGAGPTGGGADELGI